MKKNIGDLREDLFDEIGRLTSIDLNSPDLEKEINRAKAISQIGAVIVDTAKAQIEFAKLTGKGQYESSEFMGDNKKVEEKKEEKPKRPESVYTNIPSPLGIANGG